MNEALKFAREYMPSKEIHAFKAEFGNALQCLIISDEDNWEHYVQSLSEDDPYYAYNETQRCLYSTYDGSKIIALVGLVCYTWFDCPKAVSKLHYQYWDRIPEAMFYWFGRDKEEFEKIHSKRTEIYNIWRDKK